MFGVMEVFGKFFVCYGSVCFDEFCCLFLKFCFLMKNFGVRGKVMLVCVIYLLMICCKFLVNVFL